MANLHDGFDIEDVPRLLLVDDDPTFCDVLRMALERRHFEVHLANNSTDALRLAEELEPEYAVIDLRIGHESGLVVVEKLVAMDSNTRIVMLTGYASVATAVEAIKLGAVHYLPKPASIETILAALDCEPQGDAAVSAPETPMSVDRLEWEHIQRVLNEHDGNISATARALKMHRRTLQRKLLKRPVRA